LSTETVHLDLLVTYSMPERPLGIGHVTAEISSVAIRHIVQCIEYGDAIPPP
jgi:hypothetical protein